MLPVMARCKIKAVQTSCSIFQHSLIQRFAVRRPSYVPFTIIRSDTIEMTFTNASSGTEEALLASNRCGLAGSKSLGSLELM